LDYYFFLLFRELLKILNFCFSVEYSGKSSADKKKRRAQKTADDESDEEDEAVEEVDDQPFEVAKTAIQSMSIDQQVKMKIGTFYVLDNLKLSETLLSITIRKVYNIDQ
jgi:hypothetical protein